MKKMTMGRGLNMSKGKWGSKKAVIFLQAGTFLEYFDLMLFVHMSVLLNTFFFPQSDPYIAGIISAFAFSSSYILRPFAALIFGFLGDRYGRKPTVMITMMMMGIPCGILTILPTYQEWGITSTVIVTLCRMLQGMSSLGEIVGAEIYLIETIKRPQQYSAVALLAVSASLGSFVALSLSSMAAASSGNNWRWVFSVGLTIAFAGSFVRTRLRETPEFVDMKLRLKKAIEKGNKKEISHIQRRTKQEDIHTPREDYKTVFMAFLMQCCSPLCFYFGYMYCGVILKTVCHYTPAQIIYQNLLVAVIKLFAMFVIVFLVRYIYPLKILKVKLCIFLVFILSVPYVLENIHESTDPLIIEHNARLIFWIQSFCIVFTPSTVSPIVYAHFPILKRFTYASWPFAISRAVMSVGCFGIVVMVSWVGSYWGILFIFLPIILAFAIGLAHFSYLEKKTGNYPGFVENKLALSVA
jgi:MFS family permease